MPNSEGIDRFEIRVREQRKIQPFRGRQSPALLRRIHTDAYYFTSERMDLPNDRLQTLQF